MKLIIAGGRDFNNTSLLDDAVCKVAAECYENNIYRLRDPGSEIVSGEARGADTLGEAWAEEYGVPVKKFPANWNKYGKRAGHVRNELMGNYADELIAFWDGESKGTKDMIDIMIRLKKPVTIVSY